MTRRLRQALRQLFGIVPALDLHGFGVQDAVRATEGFLLDAQASAATEVRIVYGKGNRSPGGRGVLREVIPHWLEHEGSRYVERYERLPDASGADGSVRVWLKRQVADAVPLPEGDGGPDSPPSRPGNHP